MVLVRMIVGLILMINLPISFEESGSDYNGPLSTYQEWHSTLFGIGYGSLLVISALFGGGVFFASAAASVRALLFAHTGRTVKVMGNEIELPAKYQRQIRNEPHYFDGGFLFAVILWVSIFSAYGIAVLPF